MNRYAERGGPQELLETLTSGVSRNRNTIECSCINTQLSFGRLCYMQLVVQDAYHM